MIKSILLLVLNVFMAKSLSDKCSENSTKRPNIIFLMSDDMGWNDIGYHSDQIQTPNLDTLASDGIRFERYYTQPLCTPSRGAALTGRLKIRSKL
jgi:arylsulfatase A-like enzyme